MSLISAKAAIRDLAAKAQTVVDDGTLAPAEKMSRLDDYQAELKKYQDEISVHEKAAAFAVGAEAPTEVKSGADTVAGQKTLGREIIENPAYREASVMAASRNRFSKSFELKAAATVTEGSAISGGFLNGGSGSTVLPNYLPGIVDFRFAPLSVSSLFAQGTTDSPIISYVKQATETIGVGPVAEAAAKPQMDATFARLNEQVGKIAGWYKITDEMLQDAAYIESFLTNHLIAQVQREEENEVLNGTGYPAINGILNRTGFASTISGGTTGTITAPLKFGEAIFQQVTAIRTNAFFEPDAVVINPTDWQYLQLAKDGNSQYFSGGPFSGSYGNGGYSNVYSLWGLRVVLSTRIAAGTALVGAFEQGAQLFRRQGITVEMANQNQDDFINNLILVRAESRAALVVTRPGVFGKVTVTWA